MAKNKCGKQPVRFRTGHKKYNIEEFEGNKGVCKLVLWDKKTGSKVRTVRGQKNIRKVLSGK